MGKSLFLGGALLLTIAISHGFPQNEKFHEEDFDEIDSSEYGQFKGPKPTNCTCGTTNKALGRIIGGREADLNEFPHMAGVVRIQRYGRHLSWFCGASILTPYHALTAAHCPTGEVEPLGIVVGEHDNKNKYGSQYKKMYPVDKIIVHPEYKDDTMKNDIAIFVTKEKIEFNAGIGPICLPTSPMNKFLVGKIVKVTGWGRTIPGDAESKSSSLLKVNLKVIPLDQCIKQHKKKPSNIKSVVFENQLQFCTFRKEKDSCQADSGGPVIWLDPDTNRYTLVGLVSFGYGCANDYPGVNTDVYTYLPWIQEKISSVSPSPVNTCAKSG